METMMQTSKRPDTGVTLDLFYPENPVVVMRLSAEDAVRLRAFLQSKDVGMDEALWSAVYNPLDTAQKKLAADYLRRARVEEGRAESRSFQAARLREIAEAYT